MQRKRNDRQKMALPARSIHTRQMPFTRAYERLSRHWFLSQGGRSRFLRNGRQRLHVLDIPGGGSLPTLVLVHGFTATALTQYLPLVRLLRPFFSRIIAPDLPGHGLSSIPPLGLSATTLLNGFSRVLDEMLQDEPCIVFGSSLGGGVVTRHAAKKPGSLLGLILCSPGGAPSQHGKDALLHSFQIRDWQGALSFTDKLFPSPLSLRYLYALGIWRQFSRPHFKELLENLSDADFLTEEDLRNLSMPTLVIWGKEEKILTIDQREFFRAHLPLHASMIMPEHFGHAPFIDRPAVLARYILEFSRTLGEPVASMHSAAKSYGRTLS